MVPERPAGLSPLTASHLQTHVLGPKGVREHARRLKPREALASGSMAAGYEKLCQRAISEIHYKCTSAASAAASLALPQRYRSVRICTLVAAKVRKDYVPGQGVSGVAPRTPSAPFSSSPASRRSS
jgi:hypothetical protein